MRKLLLSIVLCICSFVVNAQSLREWVADGQSIVGQTYTENGHEITIVKLSVTDFDLVVVEYIWNLSEIEARAMSSLLKGNLTKVCETFMKGGNLNDVMLKRNNFV